jgi:DNA-directed RNA polymerase alpha subunit
VPFLFYGPGIFHAKNIPWPNGVQCRNPESYLVTLAPGAILRGYILVQKGQLLNLNPKENKPWRFGEPWPTPVQVSEKDSYPWLSFGCPVRLIKRVGFRMESIGPLSEQNEILIFEVLTNGRISPRQALREASLLLVHKFLAIANTIIPWSHANQNLKIKKENSSEKLSFFLRDRLSDSIFFQENSEQTFYKLFDAGFSNFRDPFRLDLRNLDLTKERYSKLRKLGFQTIGQLLERLALESVTIHPILKKQVQKALLRLGFLPL